MILLATNQHNLVIDLQAVLTENLQQTTKLVSGEPREQPRLPLSRDQWAGHRSSNVLVLLQIIHNVYH